MSGGRGPTDARSGVQRLLDVLAAFEDQPGALAVADVATASRLPLSTTYRLVRELVAWGGLERMADGRYRTGPRLRRLARQPTWEEELRAVCAPLARRFVAEWGHAVALSAWDGTRLVCVDTISGRCPTIELASSGDELPVLATSAGKLLLATTASRFDPLGGPLPPRTSAALIARQLAFARRNGYCVAYGEVAASQASLSVPVGAVNRGHLALTVMTPLRDSSLGSLVAPLRRTAAALRSVLDSHWAGMPFALVRAAGPD